MQNPEIFTTENQGFFNDENHDNSWYSTSNSKPAEALLSQGNAFQNCCERMEAFETGIEEFNLSANNACYQECSPQHFPLQPMDANHQNPHFSGGIAGQFNYDQAHCLQLHSPQESTPNFFPNQKSWNGENPFLSQAQLPFVCKWTLVSINGGWTICNHAFQNLDELSHHLSTLHIRRVSKANFPCHWENCPRHNPPFKERSKLEAHVRTHTGHRPFICDICRQPFARSENLLNHRRTHTGEKPFPCPYSGCTKRFSNSSDRKKHLDTHSEFKKYKCEKCEQSYKHSSSRRKHNCPFEKMPLPKIQRRRNRGSLLKC